MKKIGLFMMVLMAVRASTSGDDAPVVDSVKDAIKNATDRSMNLFNQTVKDIGDETRKMSNEIEKNLNQTSTSLTHYITDIVKDVIGFFKSIFGETDSPGEPALAEPAIAVLVDVSSKASLAPPIGGGSRYAEKTVYLTLLSLLVYCVLTYTPQKQTFATVMASEQITDDYHSYYRNLNENFL